MEYAAHTTPPMGQSPFFYYNPDPSPENRQHGHFTPHPHGLPMAVLPSSPEHMMHYPQMYHQRPQSAGAPMFYQHAPAYMSQAMLTPVASPRAQQHRPSLPLVLHDQRHLRSQRIPQQLRYLAGAELQSTMLFQLLNLRILP